LSLISLKTFPKITPVSALDWQIQDEIGLNCIANGWIANPAEQKNGFLLLSDSLPAWLKKETSFWS